MLRNLVCDEMLGPYCLHPAISYLSFLGTANGQVWNVLLFPFFDLTHRRRQPAPVDRPNVGERNCAFR
jgi:hypothetical protein